MLTDLLEKHKLVRRVLLVWACWLISYTVINFFEHYEDTSSVNATVITAIIGILTVVIGFYQSHRRDDDKFQKK